MELAQPQDDLRYGIEGLRVSPCLLLKVSQRCSVVGVQCHEMTIQRGEKTQDSEEHSHQLPVVDYKCGADLRPGAREMVVS